MTCLSKNPHHCLAFRNLIQVFDMFLKFCIDIFLSCGWEGWLRQTTIIIIVMFLTINSMSKVNSILLCGNSKYHSVYL